MGPEEIERPLMFKPAICTVHVMHSVQLLYAGIHNALSWVHNIDEALMGLI